MSLRRRLIRLLDRPGGRTLLALAATCFARARNGLDVRIFYDDGWFHWAGGVCSFDSAAFNYFSDTPLHWKNRDSQEELGSVWWHVYRPRAGDVVVDIGAGTGTDTFVFSKAVGNEGRVLAVEAHPRTYRWLVNTCKYNRLENVIPCHRAVTDGATEVYITDNAHHLGNSIIPTLDQNCLQTPVPGASLDQICREQGIDHIDFLKVNVEGAERFVIRGMSEMIGRIRHLCIACHDFLAVDGEDFRTKQLVIDFLQASGFEVVCRDADPRPCVQGHVHAVSP